MIDKQLNEWLLNGEKGLSSEAIVTKMTGINFNGTPWHIQVIHLILKDAWIYWPQFRILRIGWVK